MIAVLRQETAGRKPAEKALAMLADPVFSADDARIAQQKDNTAATRRGHRHSPSGRLWRAGFREAPLQPHMKPKRSRGWRPPD